MYVKNILFSLVIAFIFTLNSDAMRCIIKKVPRNCVRQLTRYTNLEQNVLYMLQDLHQQAVAIGTPCCSDAYKTKNSDDCRLVACCFQQNATRVSDSVRIESLLREADTGVGISRFLVRSKKCIDTLHEIKRRAQKTMLHLDPEGKNRKEHQYLRGLIAHKIRCIRKEIDIIEKNISSEQKKQAAADYRANKALLKNIWKIDSNIEIADVIKLSALSDEIELKNKEAESVISSKKQGSRKRNMNDSIKE